MGEKSPFDREFDLFQESRLPGRIPGDDSPYMNELAGAIRADLVSSRYKLAGYFLGLSLVGYFLSLAICAQNGVGFLGAGERAELLMEMIPHPWCALLCGALFNGVPFLLSFVFLNRFQRRYLLFRMFWLPTLVPLLGCLGLFFLAPHANHMTGAAGTSFYGVWTISAILCPYLVEGVVAFFTRQKMARG